MRTYSLFLVLLVAALSSATALAQGQFGPETRLTDVIVKVEAGVVELPQQVADAAIEAVSVRVPEIASILAQHGATRVLRSFPDANPADTVLVSELGHQIRLIDRTLVFRFRFPATAPLETVVEQLSEASGIIFATLSPEYGPGIGAVRVASPSDPFTRGPDDPAFGPRQWNLRHTGSGFQPPVTDGGRADIRALEAWNLFKGSPDVRIGIIDTGMRLSHEELSGKVTGDPQATTGDPVYDSHGTHVGGIAAALTNNNKGIAGVDWHAQLISRNVHPFSPEVIYDKIISAANAGSHILNNSWEGTASNHLVGLAFAAVHNANILPIAITHNHSQELTIYPAALWEVLAVGSSNHENFRSGFSNWGNYLEVVAPGGLGGLPNHPANIYSTWATANSAYAYERGTSMAAPHVAGLALLIRGYAQQQHGITLYHDDLRQIIRRNTDKIRPDWYNYNLSGWNEQVGFGRINAHKALLMVRDNAIVHGAVTGGTVHTSSNQFLMQIHGAPGLASTTYAVRRHEVRRTVTLPTMDDRHVWSRSLHATGTTGWSSESPNYAKHWTDLVSVGSTTATLRTYVYEVWTLAGQYLGYWPASPSTVRFAYTVVGKPAPPPPPVDVYITGSTLMNDGEEGTWTAHASGGTGSYSYTWSYRYSGSFWWQPIENTDGDTAWQRLFCSEGTGATIRVVAHSGGVQGEAEHNVGLLCQGLVAGDGLPEAFSLAASYPNPFGETAEIAFGLPENAHVTLIVYDVLGREVARLVHGRLDAGFHSVAFDAGSWTSGVYVYRIEAVGTESGERFTKTRQMTLAR